MKIMNTESDNGQIKLKLLPNLQDIKNMNRTLSPDTIFEIHMMWVIN